MTDAFRADVLAGLAAVPKRLPSKYFYDAEGSRLFEEITRTPEYYPTRAETALLRRAAPEIAGRLAAGAALVEFGSGASVKTRLLLDAAPQLARYIPIDISPDALAEATLAIGAGYPTLSVEPIVADFTRPISLPDAVLAAPRMGFFPGSTIGNFGPDEAVEFLVAARGALGPDASFLIGIDLVKAPDVLEAAYDDRGGVTAAFNKNLLVRINRELGADFDTDAFSHSSRWNATDSRMEMHLVSRRPQRVRVDGHIFDFGAGESIHTENSHKFTVDDFFGLAMNAGWRAGPAWTETEPAFALVLLEA